MPKTLIIAEAGVNHNGSIELAREMINVASNAGADVIKFQTFKTVNLVTELADMAEYQKTNTGKIESQFQMLKKLEFDFQAHLDLIDECKNQNILFCSTAFDLSSIDLLNSIGLPFWKIPSGEIDNVPYLRKIAAFNHNIIMSTGMCNLSDIEFALETLIGSGTNKENITVLHCNTQYPTPIEDVNLNAMLTIKEAFKVRVGYSDHTLGIEIPVAAVALGAEVIEKHFTLDKKMKGPDHIASLDPEELKTMVTAVRNTELALGSGVKAVSKSEQVNISIVRKSLFAAKDIRKGDFFTDQNVTVKRPGSGIHARNWDQIIGCKSTRNFNHGDLIVYP